MNEPCKKPVYDLWLDKYAGVLDTSRDLPILDLGCGRGNDSLYLTERGFKVISCDISEDNIVALKTAVPEAQVMVVDMLGGLPFGDGSFSVVIADLCLHYFKWEDTAGIVSDIGRALKRGGVLLCRLNSTKDVHHGAGRGECLEENFYNVNGITKRFFDERHVTRLFTGWEMLHIGEYCMDRFKLPKMLWEIAVRKI